MIEITKTYKFKLKLTKSQADRVNNWISTCRYLYNVAKEVRESHYQKFGTTISKYDLMKQLTPVRAEFDWVKDIPVQTCQDVIERLDSAYQKFFRDLKSGKNVGFPKWAKKGKYRSVTFKSIKQHTHNRFKLPKIGSVKYFASRKVEGEMKRAIIIKEHGGYYISVVTKQKTKPVKVSDSQIGLDWGVKYLLSTSNGGYIENIDFTRKHEEQLAFLNKQLARRKKGGSNWIKTKKKLQKLHSKIARTRKDYFQKVSYRLTQKYGYIAMENLNIQGMVRKPKPKPLEDGVTYLPNMAAAKAGLNKSILNTAPAMLSDMIEYKTNWNAGFFEKVPAPNSSRECSECGHTSKKNRKTQSEFECQACGHTENADTNASKVILSRASFYNRSGSAPMVMLRA